MSRAGGRECGDGTASGHWFTDEEDVEERREREVGHGLSFSFLGGGFFLEVGTAM